MKYINKYIKFFENETLVDTTPQTKTIEKTDKVKELASEQDVVNRFERIYKYLSIEEKTEINQYFEK
jgi:hypothetical protein